MSTGPRHCPRCHVPIEHGTHPHLCLDREGRTIQEDSLVQSGQSHVQDPLEETIAYQGGPFPPIDQEGSSLPNDFEDGFPAIDDLVDRTLGQYQLDTIVGRGTMGRVYRAKHVELERFCAIKVMNPGLVAKQPQIRERFWAEARAVATLLHPHVVTVHNLGSDRGYHYIEMEYVPGGNSLKESLVRDGPFDSVRASTVVRQVVMALGAAHESGMVHRDVKPSNVLLTAEGDAKLADFGLVRRISELERAGVPVAGTPTFMAPELFAGIPASNRSDIYAVGVMYFYLLSARLPFASDHMGELISLHRFGQVPDLRNFAPETSEQVLSILKRCLEKHPEDRYQSADELTHDLQVAIFNLRDTESLVRESVDGLNCFLQGGRDLYRILFELPNDRLQEVYLEVSQGDHGQRVLSVFSVCGPADPKHYEFALKLNDRLTYGSLSIRNVNGQPMFVMTRAFPRDLVSAADIRAALLEIAGRADHVEMQLTNADLY